MHQIDSTQLLAIIKKVAQLSSMDLDSKLLVEYGDNDHIVAQYQVTMGTIKVDSLVFDLQAVISQCKAIESADGCCSSADSQCCA